MTGDGDTTYATVYIGLGSNLGDRRKNIADALGMIATIDLTTLIRAAGIYETEPVGGPSGQDMYCNTVCQVRTGLEPLPFLHALQRIEIELGRDRSPDAPRWGPRTIDLDILFWDDMLMETPELTIPHPRAAEREFVLVPMLDVAAEFVHPGLNETVQRLWEKLGTDF
ncbi:MAG: 2-amino-4-hydroxy-6-hydroxymethyldihydropteridine diphosphokinase [Planctomycetes bacterium]|nr:2-amino-4-hydroxy-6-hydroxymethyldihydropteridine diphosphokinase [Planctomycetota bacterium]